MWVSWFNGGTELKPDGTTAGPFAIGIIPAGTGPAGLELPGYGGNAVQSAAVLVR
jgi:hypothetical protein